MGLITVPHDRGAISPPGGRISMNKYYYAAYYGHGELLNHPGTGSALPDLICCPKCGFYVHTGKTACPYCGTILGPAAAPGRSQQPQDVPSPVESGKPVSRFHPDTKAPAPSWTDRVSARFRLYMFLFALYVLCPDMSWWETIKKYFRIAFLFFVVVALSYGFTGQWISGLIAGIVVLFLIYRSFMQMHETLESLEALNPVPVLVVMTAILAVILTLLLLFPLPPMKTTYTSGELGRMFFTHGTLLIAGIAGYFITRRPKK